MHKNNKTLKTRDSNWINKTLNPVQGQAVVTNLTSFIYVNLNVSYVIRILSEFRINLYFILFYIHQILVDVFNNNGQIFVIFFIYFLPSNRIEIFCDFDSFVIFIYYNIFFP